MLAVFWGEVDKSERRFCYICSKWWLYVMKAFFPRSRRVESSTTTPSSRFEMRSHPRACKSAIVHKVSLPGCYSARVIKQSNVTLTRETNLHIFRVLPGFKINDHGHGACLCSHFSPKSPEQQQLGMYHHHSTWLSINSFLTLRLFFRPDGEYWGMPRRRVSGGV